MSYCLNVCIITDPSAAPRNICVTVNSSTNIILTWESPPMDAENGLLLVYHLIVIETQIQYSDDGEEIRGMERYLNRTYNVSEGRVQLIDMLHPDYNYTVRIAAATEPGIGPFSDPITVRTYMDGEKTAFFILKHKVICTIVTPFFKETFYGTYLIKTN